MERPPVWESFKVKDIPNLPGTKLGDFVVESVYRESGKVRVLLVCPTCGRARLTTLDNANTTVGKCKHRPMGVAMMKKYE
jgi:4-hydroxy-3-methylbut-2-en-1-yl diphosphate synthase IspG/GcpE